MQQRDYRNLWAAVRAILTLSVVVPVVAGQPVDHSVAPALQTAVSGNETADGIADQAGDAGDAGEYRGLVRSELDAQGRIIRRSIESRPLLHRSRSDNRSTTAGTSSEPSVIQWDGSLLIREAGQYRFHASVSGSVAVELDQKAVLETDSSSVQFDSGEVQVLPPGEHALRVRYLPAEAADQLSLQLFWSSDRFTLEPLPADVLYHQAEDGSQLESRQRGWMLADALRCAACHREATAMSVLSAPDLRQVLSVSDEAVLIKRLTNPQSVVADSSMPHFDLTADEASAVVAFLKNAAAITGDRAKAGAATGSLKFKQDDPAKGAVLVRSLGCVACHSVPPAAINSEQGDVGMTATPVVRNVYSGPTLVGVGSRRSVDWLWTWLKNPEAVNASHRMPIFDLSDDERRQLVAAMLRFEDGASAASKQDSGVSADPEDARQVEAGRQLVAAANCAACHQLPGEASKGPALPPARISDDASVAGCLRMEDRADAVRQPASGGSLRVPRFAVSESDRIDLLNALKQPYEHAEPVSSLERGQRMLHRKGCVACHDRDLSPGISQVAALLERTDPELRGRSQALIPPSLTAVGDKLTEAYLKTAVSGLQKSRRLPWLMVRMPRFQHTEQDLEDLIGTLITSDRIPDAADAARPEIIAALRSDEPGTEELLIGNQLAGAGGFNCVACHSAGSFEPRNVALGTRGSDLLAMGGRLRPRFFQRWMKNPIRVVAGIEMPAIRRAAPGILNDSLDQQMAVLWSAISDPRFTAPTVVSRYEQFVTVSPGQRPRVIRDVFTLSEDRQRRSVARALAIGFSNGHNLLLDLDTMGLQQWTVGEFARQRTEGKSWFWGTAGVTVASAMDSSPADPTSWLLIPLADSPDPDKPIPAVIDESRTTELLRYSSDDRGVDVWYRVHFSAVAKPKNAAAAAASSERVGSPPSPHTPVTAWNDAAHPVQSVIIHERLVPVSAADQSGVQRTGVRRTIELVDASPSAAVQMMLPRFAAAPEFRPEQSLQVGAETVAVDLQSHGKVRLRLNLPVDVVLTTAIAVPSAIRPEVPPIVTTAETVSSVPGFTGTRLPINSSIMPTAMTWLPDGRMAFTSLRGHVWIASDTDGDHMEDTLELFEEGLAAPFGILVDGDSIIVAHKPEILRLRDSDGDGRADLREVVAAGWGYSDDYHDWTSGLLRDSQKNMYVGLGSDYSQKNRDVNRDRWRGTVLKIDPSGVPSPVAFALRYPMGLALDSGNRLFATDNQGVQNTFNEINHIIPGSYYGVPSRYDSVDQIPQQTPAVQVPHPWTRSVNSILFFPQRFAAAEFAGHGIGCEYDLRFLIRFTVQDVDGIVQGAVYPFSRPGQEAGGSNFIGPICSAVSPDGALYIGSIWDSGWQGGPNTGGISRLVPDADRPNGIQEVQALKDGLRVTFIRAVDETASADPTSYLIQGYTRKWGGSYATPDSDRHQVAIRNVTCDKDGRTVRLFVEEMKEGYVYDLAIAGSLSKSEPLWPDEAHLTLKHKPTTAD